MRRKVALVLTIAAVVASGCTHRRTAADRVHDERCPGATTDFSAASNERLQGALFQGPGPYDFDSAAVRKHDVEANLRPGRERRAAELTRQYGDQLHLTVGGVEYCGHPGTSPVCPPLPPVTPTPPNLRFHLSLEHPSIKATGALSGTLTAHASADPTYRVDTGQPLVGFLVKPRTRTVVSRFTGAIAGTGYNLTAAPGTDGTVGVLVGTARCDGGRGSGLPPGRYGVLVELKEEGPVSGPIYLSDEAPLEVVR